MRRTTRSPSNPSSRDRISAAERSTSRCQAASFARMYSTPSWSSTDVTLSTSRTHGGTPGECDLLWRQRGVPQDRGERAGHEVIDGNHWALHDIILVVTHLVLAHALRPLGGAVFATLLALVVAGARPVAQSGAPQMPAFPCDVQTTERIVAVGDIHGAFDQFVAILRAAGIIDNRNRWSGKKAVLVQTGDVLDRVPIRARRWTCCGSSKAKRSGRVGVSTHCLAITS